MDNVSDAVKGGVSKVAGVASVGVQAAGKVLDKVIK
jgi:hypothetical protein